MFYREAGQFKTSYAADQAIFPIRQDRLGMLAILVIAYLVVPFAANEYWLSTIFVPFFVFAVAALGLNIVLVFIAAGLVTAGVGLLFGIPSLRIKGFYLAVATLAAQFFLIWLFVKVPWFQNYSASGVITAPPRAVLGHFFVTGPEARPVN